MKRLFADVEGKLISKFSVICGQWPVIDSFWSDGLLAAAILNGSYERRTPIRCGGSGRGGGGVDVRGYGRAARAAGGAAGAWGTGGEKDPDLGRRAVQFHQYWHGA
jgi:hypothetical protein